MKGDCEMNNQAIFLAKIQQALTLLDEIDDIITNNPEMQQNVDWEISDYLHILENEEELSDDARLEIDKQLARCRKMRRQLVNIYTIGKVFNDNRDKLRYKNQREFLVSNIKSQVNKLDNDYKYRVLDQETINSYITKKEKIVEKPKITKLGKKRISKEELLEMINSGLKNKEIAEKIGLSPSALCHLKDEYGIARRAYKKKGE